jgi:6-pyruvoyltetrahydropterin/6-carboxytetrahydropterin synthase
VSRRPTYRILLAKQDFKFSAAHFTLFGDGRAEQLHGHNYRLEVHLEGADLDRRGLLLELDPVKAAIRAACRRLDGRTLIAAGSADLACRRQGDSVEVRFAERTYRFPAAEVMLLPLTNSSIELLARMLWDELAPELAGSPVEILGVTVEETEGQSCRYEAPLGGAEEAP